MKYETPACEVINVEASDIITTSSLWAFENSDTPLADLIEIG